MKVYLPPPETHTNGGIRRVVEAQYRYLPDFGIQVTTDPMEAEVEAYHVSGTPKNPRAAMVLHNHGMMWSEYQFPQWADQINQEIVESMRYAWKITTPSKWVEHAISRGVYFPTQTIYHGVDTEQYEPVAPGEVGDYILWNKARVDEVSNPDDMNRLAALLPDIRFVSTFGKPTDNVTVFGNLPQDHMEGAVRHAGLYLCTARETFGIGTLEALASGVPVVGWDYGGQSEIIVNGETGELVPYGDYAALSERVRYVLAHRQRYADNAVHDARTRWLWKDRIREYAMLYFGAAAWYSAPRLKVSVIVPAHNLGQFLPYTLHSIQRQTMPNFECLIVDDYSTDNTSEIARAIVDADIRFRYLRTYKNLGLSEVRNYGAQNAFGKYIQYVDADDMIPENTLQILSDALDSQRNVHVVYGALDLMTEDGQYTRRNAFPQTFDWYRQMAHQNQVPTGAMMRREVIEQSGGWRTRQWRAEDAEFWARVTSMGYVAKKVTDETTLLYRTRRNSKGSTEFRTYADRDGNWLANIAWRSANSAQEGMTYLSEHSNAVPQPDLVPFGAAAQRGQKFWRVSHRQEPLVTIVVKGERNIEDTLDSIQGQYLDNWRVYVVGEPLKGFPFVTFISPEETIPVGDHVLVVNAGEMFPNDWLNQQLHVQIDHAGLLPTDKVLLKYIGRNKGRTAFRVNNNIYHGEAGQTIWAIPEDAIKLVSRGQWKYIQPTSIPEPQLADQRK